MGAQRGSVDDVRAYWKLQDRIDLSEAERKAINFRIQEVNGMQQALWDGDPKAKPKEFEFAPDEFDRIKKMVREWQPGFLTTADRRWLEPLLGQLDNGQPKEAK
jgi:hypothetical protein